MKFKKISSVTSACLSAMYSNEMLYHCPGVVIEQIFPSIDEFDAENFIVSFMYHDAAGNIFLSEYPICFAYVGGCRPEWINAGNLEKSKLDDEYGLKHIANGISEKKQQRYFDFVCDLNESNRVVAYLNKMYFDEYYLKMQYSVASLQIETALPYCSHGTHEKSPFRFLKCEEVVFTEGSGKIVDFDWDDIDELYYIKNVDGSCHCAVGDDIERA